VRALERRLEEILLRPAPPEPELLAEVVVRATETLASEPEEVRPADLQGLPGGLVTLRVDLPTIIVPDLHARMDFLMGVLSWPLADGLPVLQLLASGELQLLCLGDGVHAEGRAIRRWKAAFREFMDGFQKHANMDEEMRESLGLMEMVMELKCSLPSQFHFLKGNHENITNEEGEGNHPFVKFVQEGFMVAAYMERFYGGELLHDYSRFEKALPLLAVGRGFLASHAEPAEFYPRDEVICYRDFPEVVYGLTWTENDQAEPDSVRCMLEHYLGDEAASEAFYFGGHRPIRELYRLRSDGQYVQIHDPDRWVVALIPAQGKIQLERDIVELGVSSPLADSSPPNGGLPPAAGEVDR
jgi:hypothetical protein